MPITLHEITDTNWRDVAMIAPRDEQRAWVAPLAAYYLLLSSREGLWHSLAIQSDGRVVGHVMWAVDDVDGSYWIGGLMIAGSEQGRGYGRAAMAAIMHRIRADHLTAILKLSYHPDNSGAAALYGRLGFQSTGEKEGDEVVVAWSGTL
jgi:diamine N-acetyltransferase